MGIEAGSADEEELMWLAGPASDDSEEWAAELEQGTGGWHRDEPAAGEEPAGGVPSSPDAGMGLDVEQRLGAVAAEEGWDESEVEAIRAYLSGVQPPAQAESAGRAEREGPETEPAASPPPGREARSGFELPGGDELDAALAALRQPAPPAQPATTQDPPAADGTAGADRDPAREWAKSHAELEALASAPRPDVPWPGMDREPHTMPSESRPEPPAPTPQPTASAEETPALEPEPEWMRGRQDAAARAYRRLRRIFPNSER